LLRGRALFGLAVMLRSQGDNELASARLAEYFAIFNKPGDKRRQAVALNGMGLIAMDSALNGMGLIAMDSGDLTAAIRHFSESLTLRRTVDNPFDLPYVLANLSHAVEFEGDLEENTSWRPHACWVALPARSNRRNSHQPNTIILSTCILWRPCVRTSSLRSSPRHGPRVRSSRPRS
jgi:hypothetical protein